MTQDQENKLDTVHDVVTTLVNTINGELGIIKRLKEQEARIIVLEANQNMSKGKAAAITGIATGGGLIGAAATYLINHAKVFAVLTSLLAAVGCTTYHSHQEMPDGTTTDVRINNFWDGKSELHKLAASTTSTNKSSQKVGIGSINSEANSTNVNVLIEGVVRAAIEAAKK